MRHRQITRALLLASTVALLLAGCGATGTGPVSGPLAEATTDIPSCGSESSFSDMDDEHTDGDVSVLYDPALTAVDPFCGQERTKVPSGKQFWHFFYEGATVEATVLGNAFVESGWTPGTSEGYYTLVESNGNNRTAHIIVEPAVDPDSVFQTYFIGVPAALEGADIVIVTID